MRGGVTHVVGIPDNMSGPLFDEVALHAAIQLVTVTREGEAFAVAAGLWLGGASPIVVIQNTGLLESGDAIRGTAQRMGAPVPVIVTGRGYEKMERLGVNQDHALTRELLTRPDVDSTALLTEPTFNAWGIPFWRCSADSPIAGIDPSPWHPCRAPSDARPRLVLTVAQLLGPLARYRTNEAVVTTMSVVRPWGILSDSDLDFASADSAMGHAADLALGLALAQPARKVVCVNGDGSMLMSLGTLATVVGSAAENFILIVCDNGEYEITESGTQGPIGRSPAEPARYLQHSLSDWSKIMRTALLESPEY